MNRVWNAIQWFVQSFVQAVSFSAYCGSVKCLLFSGGEEKLSMHAKQASPVCHRRTCDKYLLSVNKWKQRHQFERPLWPHGFVLQVFSNLARIRPTRLSKCNVLKNRNGYYAWVFVCVAESLLWVPLYSVHPNGSCSVGYTVSQKARHCVPVPVSLIQLGTLDWWS